MAFELRHGRQKALEISHRRAAVLAQQIRNEAIQLTPVDTGRLRQSIQVRQIAPGHYRVSTNVAYALYVEFGTRYRRATPFLRPALEKARLRMQGEPRG